MLSFRNSKISQPVRFDEQFLSFLKFVLARTLGEYGGGTSTQSGVFARAERPALHLPGLTFENLKNVDPEMRSI